jgi:hypothetical protein
MRRLLPLTLMAAMMVTVGLMTVGCDKLNEGQLKTAIWVSHDIIAGQNLDVGDVEVWNDASNLYVVFVIHEADWYLTETQVSVKVGPDNFPMTKSGNPQIGKFAYKQTHANVTTYTCTIDLDQLGFRDGTVAIATHCALVKVVGGSVVQAETGWAGDEEFPGANWAKWFWYTFGVDPTAEYDVAETAWGYTIGGEYEQYYFKSNGGKKWGGYFPYALGEDVQVDLWAGAGLNDPDKGTLVGYVTVTDDVVNGAGYLYVTIVTDENPMRETHIDGFASLPQGNLPPGALDYGSKGDLADVTTYYEAIPYDAAWGTSFYMAVHATVMFPTGYVPSGDE